MSEREYMILRQENGAYVRQGFQHGSSVQQAAARWAAKHPAPGTLIVVPASSWHEAVVTVSEPAVRVNVKRGGS